MAEVEPAAAVNATVAAAASTELTLAISITYVSLVVMAIVPIWIGSFSSLPSRQDKNAERMSSKDAWMFPLIGSCVLFGLYLVFKFINKDLVNLLIAGYFLLFGIAALCATFSPVLRWLFKIKASKKTKYNYSFHVPLIKEPYKFNFDDIDILAFIISSGLGAWYVYEKHWIMNNFLGLAFATQGVSLLNLGSWQVGAILLSGLFIYDIFWVFGTDVMVTVAKNFDAPVKLLFPRDVFAEKFQFSMLGLGDIVIPGIFIALLLRFDAHRAGGHKQRFSKPYFITCFISYILGLATTMGVMHVFKAAQPALLYLVPFCLGSSLLVAFVRGELEDLVNYSEETPKSEKKKAK